MPSSMLVGTRAHPTGIAEISGRGLGTSAHRGVAESLVVGWALVPTINNAGMSSVGTSPAYGAGAFTRPASQTSSRTGTPSSAVAEKKLT
jgi:hypothetical protein